jgi:hypothetical protein
VRDQIEEYSRHLVREIGLDTGTRS